MTPPGPVLSGATRLYGIVGDPIAQVRSPQVYTQRFAADGLDAVLVPLHVPAERFESVMPGLLALANLDGLFVTIPFKARMLPLVDRIGATARTVGAVNTLRREADGSWTGDMFDGLGLVRGFERKGVRLAGRRVALFGAGGAGSAIACALAEAQVASIDVIDVEARRAEALVARLAPVFPAVALARAGQGVPAGVDMIVNASPVGMRPGDGLPGAIGAVTRGTIIGDVVVSSQPTPIIRLAIEHHCPFVDGKDLHAGQVETVLEFLRLDRRPAG